MFISRVVNFIQEEIVESGEKKQIQNTSFLFINESGAFAKFKKMGFFAGCEFSILGLMGFSYMDGWLVVPFIPLILSFSSMKELCKNELSLKYITIATVLFVCGSIVAFALGGASVYLMFSGSVGKALFISTILPAIIVGLWGTPLFLAFKHSGTYLRNTLLYYAGISVAASAMVEAIFHRPINANMLMVLAGAFLAYAFYTTQEEQIITQAEEN